MDFKQMIADRHKYARAWKERTGGKVLGYFEPYFPEELAYAAGILPVRILAEHEPDELSDKWLYGPCYPVRDMVNLFLKGRYDYVDGLVNVEGCQWIYNGFEVICNNDPSLFSYYLFVPDVINEATSKEVMRSELAVFQAKLETWAGCKITDKALDEAIQVCNENRRLLRRIYALRRADRPVLHGSEAMNIVLASQVIDKAEMNRALAAFIPELEAREPFSDRLRLMLIGSETWDSGLEEMVEALGGDIVIDELDNGSSYFWNEVFEQRDRLMAIGLRYLDRPHSAVKDNNWRRRPEQIFQLAEDWHVDGAIIAKQIYCHLHGVDNYAVWKLLRERSIPFHYLERDMSLPKEETQLRLEAFMNMLRPGVTRLMGWHKNLAI